MATINRPTTLTQVSTTAWGIPITDQVNANTTAIASGAPGAWVSMTLVNGWTNFGSGYSITMYRKRGDMVDLKGTMQGGASSSIFTTMPVGFRPVSNLQQAIRDGYMVMGSDGGMQFAGAATFSGVTSFVLSFPTT